MINGTVRMANAAKNTYGSHPSKVTYSPLEPYHASTNLAVSILKPIRVTGTTKIRLPCQ